MRTHTCARRSLIHTWKLKLISTQFEILCVMALSKRALKSAAHSAFLFRRGLYSSSSVSTNGVIARASELVKSGGKRAFPVDTLALVRGLEAKGVPTAHAEAITSAVTGIYTDSLENVHQLQKVMPCPPPVRRFASLQIFDWNCDFWWVFLFRIADCDNARSEAVQVRSRNQEFTGSIVFVLVSLYQAFLIASSLLSWPEWYHFFEVWTVWS